MTSRTAGTTMWLALWKTARDVQRAAEDNIADLGLCLTDFAVLETLLNVGPQRANVVAGHVMVSSGSMTAAIDRLANRGLIRRTADASDGRARVLELTDDGRALIEPAFATHSRALEKAFSALTLDDRTRLLSLLLKVRASLREGDAA